MKAPIFPAVALAVCTALCLEPQAAWADDGGTDDAGADVHDGGDPTEVARVPLACDGALCDTTNDSTCGMSRRGGADAPLGLTAGAFALVLTMLVRRRASLRAHGPNARSSSERPTEQR
ncbi:hypothetical protein [Labilithrix luteola]|uniref:hypothetical protein n=1 Tax=Labilithrix luteola TaxID=1391654 RepID=UPI0011BA8C20|nr:hypothetical protein [Labilithrix luteola]